MSKRVMLIVLDSVGIGALPDAYLYGDEGSNTLGNIARQVKLSLPNLRRLGLGNILPLEGIPPVPAPLGAYGKMGELSPGKDTTTGHWELAGIVLDKPFPLYPKGFPREIIDAFEKRIGKKVLGNKAASGTVIIEELGEEHMATGSPIVYTSADSVFQIAAHEEVIPLEELYEMCRVAREILQGDHAVGRVIARPFVGTPGKFQRTANRHDYSIDPPSPTMLDLIKNRGLEVVGVGKIGDIFSGKGLTKSIPTKSNADGIDRTIAAWRSVKAGLVFTNLVDYDMKYGHRNDVEGYAKALEEFDHRLPEIMDQLKEEDLLIITADHGCDPTFPGTDHTREYVPVLVFGAKVKAGVNVGIRQSFADVGATVTGYLGAGAPPNGISMLPEISSPGINIEEPPGI
ncbi:MAG: phosphopentomutase [Clostridia bacterium]|nr:phosphopentomutase [Clostridia bacterium]